MKRLASQITLTKNRAQLPSSAAGRGFRNPAGFYTYIVNAQPREVPEQQVVIQLPTECNDHTKRETPAPAAQTAAPQSTATPDRVKHRTPPSSSVTPHESVAWPARLHVYP